MINPTTFVGNRLLRTIGFSLLMLLTAVADGQDLAGIKCVIDGDQQASVESSADYNDAKVYFCCDDCLAKFKTEIAKKDSPVAVKANHQLVLTGQYVQKACPLTGKPVAADKSVEVGGAKVGLCCGGCLAKVNAATDLAAKANMVYSDAAFEKGFELKKATVELEDVKCMFMTKKNVSAKFSTDYNGHQVYFCCKNCLGKFQKDPTAYTVKANHQLAATGQVTQVACPFSGGKVNDVQSLEVGGVPVKFCCQNCKKKMAAADEGQQIEMAFGEKAFAQAFK